MEPSEVYEEDDDKMTDYRCKDCVFRHDLKYRYSGTSKDSVSEWKYKSVCTMLIETEKSDGTFAILVENDDCCEAFCKKE